MSERAAFVQGLRDLAMFLETHPDVALPGAPQFNVYVADKEALAVQARASSWQKVYLSSLFILRKTFGPIEFDVNVARQEVCRRVVTGTRVVPATPETTVEEVEWVCEDASVLSEVGA